MRSIGFIVAAGAGLALGGCQTVGGQAEIDRLNMEIVQIGQRLVAVESDINTSTAEISRRIEGVYAQASYRPIKSWANAFSSGPEANRTATFQQTDRGGDLASQSHRCVFPFGPYRPGYWARIHEARSTRATLLVEQFAVTSDASGLILAAPIKFEARTQVGANFRAPCQGGSIGTNVGVTGEARPDTVFRLALGPVQEGAIGYNLSMVAPGHIDLEMAVHLGQIGRVRFTMPMKNIAQELGAGKVDLLYDTDGSILLPDGGQLGYRVATSNPSLRTSADGFGVGTDVTVLMDRPLAAEMAKQR